MKNSDFSVTELRLFVLTQLVSLALAWPLRTIPTAGILRSTLM